MKYAVAYMNYYDNDLQMTTVEADDPITAMIEGARTLMNSIHDSTHVWLDGYLENIPSIDSYATRIEEIRQEFFDADQVIAVMPIE